MKILILGSSGILGKNLYKILHKKFQVYHSGLGERLYNFEHISEIKKLLLKNYDIIINCVAITNLDYCEKNRKRSKIINEDLVKKIFIIKKK